MAFNAWREPVTFTIPPSPQGRPWRRVIDTALAPPLDIVSPGEGAVIHPWSEYGTAPFALLVLVSEG
jgi:glycogen operon protein